MIDVRLLLPSPSVFEGPAAMLTPPTEKPVTVGGFEMPRFSFILASGLWFCENDCWSRGLLRSACRPVVVALPMAESEFPPEPSSSSFFFYLARAA